MSLVDSRRVPGEIVIFLFINIFQGIYIEVARVFLFPDMYVSRRKEKLMAIKVADVLLSRLFFFFFFTFSYRIAS